MKLKGYVDRADALLIEGWAVDLDAHDAPVAVALVQAGDLLLTLQPLRRSPDVAKALGLRPTGEPTYRFRLVFPLANGIRPDLPFDIVFAATGQSLQHGSQRSIPVAGRMDPATESDLAGTILATPDYHMDGDRLVVGMLLYPPDERPLAIAVGQESSAAKPVAVPPVLGRRGAYATHVLDPHLHPELRQQAIHLRVEGNPGEDQRLGFHRRLRTVTVPPSVFDAGSLRGALPPAPNQVRVSGPSSSDLSYLISGATTWAQLDEIATRHFGTRLVEFGRVVDWGCGCARVLRHFLETAPLLGPTNPTQELVGLDIDEVNIEWCRSNVPSLARFQMLSLHGFDEPDASVDLLYGISVMTHLTELNQQRWLAEIARVVRPGGCVILTTHGEYATYRIADQLAVPFVQQFGFFDGVADPAIGVERQTYYRATFQDRGYLLRNWAAHFDILDVVPAANAFVQDFVVMRRR